jgi:hypothetical protein
MLIMPARDQTGPLGQGPMTGRGLGICGAHRNANNTNNLRLGLRRGYGRGVGRGLGRGMRGGYGYRFSDYEAPLSAKEEKEILKRRIDELDAIIKESE